MRRADTPACAAAIAQVVLGGCMRIYPDPELPDIEVEWFVEMCGDRDELSLALSGVDDPAFRAERVVPCADGKATFADVARERYRVEGKLRTTGGAVASSPAEDLDLRNGLDQRAWLYFGGLDNFRVAWSFELGASCASLRADSVLLEFSMDGDPDAFVASVPCERSPFIGQVPDGGYTIVARALSGTTTVAVSPASPELVIYQASFTDAGTLVLTPCGEGCDLPASTAAP